jgi:hypothetical protein
VPWTAKDSLFSVRVGAVSRGFPSRFLLSGIANFSLLLRLSTTRWGPGSVLPSTSIPRPPVVDAWCMIVAGVWWGVTLLRRATVLSGLEISSPKPSTHLGLLPLTRVEMPEADFGRRNMGGFKEGKAAWKAPKGERDTRGQRWGEASRSRVAMSGLACPTTGSRVFPPQTLLNQALWNPAPFFCAGGLLMRFWRLWSSLLGLGPADGARVGGFSLLWEREASSVSGAPGRASFPRHCHNEGR